MLHLIRQRAPQTTAPVPILRHRGGVIEA